MLQVISAVLAMIAGYSAIAFAADMTVRQKGRVFSAETMTVKKGEAITFLNDDNIPHNIMSSSSGNAFNLGLQPPGAMTPVAFKEAGDVKVICAIHPRMKMNVTVTD